MKLKPFFLLLTLIVVGCQSPEPKEQAKDPNSSNIDFEQLLENYHEGYLQLYPIIATTQGDHRYNDILPNNLSADFQEKEKQFYQGYLDQLSQVDPTVLSETQQLSYDVLKWNCSINLEGKSFPSDLTPIDQMWTLQLSFGQLASGMGAQPFNTVEDYKKWLQRVSGFVEWLGTAQAKMEEGISKGHVLPTPLILKVIPQLESMVTEDVESHLYYQPVLNMPETFSEEEKAMLTKEYSAMVADQIIPAFTLLLDFMKTAYLPNGRSTHGIGDLEGGKEYYNYCIKKFTTTNMSAQEVHELGLREVARIAGEMEKVKTEVGFEGSLKEFFDYVRTNPELMPYKTPEEIIENFNNIHKRMMPQVNQLFAVQPKTGFEVRRTEAFREASSSAEYNSGTIDGSRPGIFYTPIPDAKKYNVFQDEALFLHEAIPGHHFQISLSQENKDLPKFRKTLWYSAYGEGWALYTESLGKELGLYTDPYQYFGMLGMEMHRAIRLVVDPGMHVLGWTREQAIQYSLDNEAESEASIISEIERYMANPGQALSYKVGQLKIRELRARAEEKMGEDFDIRTFHQEILETGCIPLALLEQKIDNWIATANKD